MVSGPAPLKATRERGGWGRRTARARGPKSARRRGGPPHAVATPGPPQYHNCHNTTSPLVVNGSPTLLQAKYLTKPLATGENKCI
jgi:hypothetical protein